MSASRDEREADDSAFYGVPPSRPVRGAVFDNVGSDANGAVRRIESQHCLTGHPRGARRGDGASPLRRSRRWRGSLHARGFRLRAVHFAVTKRAYVQVEESKGSKSRTAHGEFEGASVRFFDFSTFRLFDLGGREGTTNSAPSPTPGTGRESASSRWRSPRHGRRGDSSES